MAPETIIARVLGVSRPVLTDASSNATIETWDSLNHVTLILELESTYDIALSADEALTMTDVGTIKRVLRSRGVHWDGA